MTELVARFFQVESNRLWQGRKCFQTRLRGQVRLALTLLRTDLSQGMTGEFFGVSRPTVFRVYRHVVALIDQVTGLSRQELADATRGRVVLVGGTYVPTGNRTATGRTNCSGKRRVQC